MKTPLVVGLVLAATPSFAEEARYDHRGSLGLLVGGGGEVRDFVGGPVGQSGFLAHADLGGTAAVGNNGNEVALLLRRSFLGAAPDWMANVSFRTYFGWDQVKTFFDLGAALHVMPEVTVGPRLGFGVQYELTPVLGAYAMVGAQLGFGAGIRFGGELSAGLQLRSYLLE